MIDKSLKKYIEDYIFPDYEKNDAGHRISHIEYVINRSLKFAFQYMNAHPDAEPINMNMVYVVAAYHDIGHHIDHLNHERVSAEIMACDSNLRKWFNEDEIKTMFTAICEHRSCLDGDPTTIYGKIVSSADRNTDMASIYMRCYEYRRVHNPEMNNQALAEEAYFHVSDKFGVGGYATEKMFFDDPEYDAFLRNVERVLQNREVFTAEFYAVNGISDDSLLKQMLEFEPFNEQEIVDKQTMVDFIETFDNALTRDNVFGHFTASAYVINEDGDKALMLHHNIMDDYIYPGGHADGIADLCAVAKREVKEETGLDVAPLFDGKIFAIQAAPVRGHIKKGKYVSAHIHYDVLFVFQAKNEDMDNIRVLESENKDVVWWPLSETFENELVVNWARDVNRKIVQKLNSKQMVKLP